ncbi:transcription factor IIA subunit alpha [Coniosporium apollinis]|uniref:Transcription factor IIA subunit alpha n=2 Tax=Coniosporium TaxID=2810619 RepID=A0ABQ9NFL6_9PEZI|nr:transcription factor IIA subunit alpha [Cladosporium sp. JES 115]KAJ9656028.1 transcription factor IIA subunit alpha [Coniosporium apollinis]
MSENIVGPTYAQVIDAVIAASENDFEEAGVDSQTLQELRSGWQKRLSELRVAHFPWDPPPVLPQVANPPTVPSNIPKHELSPLPANLGTPQMNSPHGYPASPHIKVEPSIKQEYTSPVQPVVHPALNQKLAHQRAQAYIANQYGDQAKGSVPAVNPLSPQPNGLSLPGQQQRPMGLQLPSQGQHRPQQPQQPQQTQQTQQTQQNYQRPQQAYPAASQYDGADDASEPWDAVLADRRAHGNDGRLAADGIMRQKLEQLAEQQDSGLFVPLDQLVKGKGKKRRSTQARSNLQTVSESPSIPQLDGELDSEAKEELDEDAINSDLDDSDEDPIVEENDDDTFAALGDHMVCTYDKVNRVKNKWKCTLKDGILHANNKDYLFHKASGDFEW